MAKTLDWNATAERARNMTTAELHYARLDAAETARVWDAAPEQDIDGNAGYYRDEASVYAAEQRRRAGEAA